MGAPLLSWIKLVGTRTAEARAPSLHGYKAQTVGGNYDQQIFMVPRAGFEPATCRLGGGCSIP
mgnify:CR=1 FL=1